MAGDQRRARTQGDNVLPSKVGPKGSEPPAKVVDAPAVYRRPVWQQLKDNTYGGEGGGAKRTADDCEANSETGGAGTTTAFVRTIAARAAREKEDAAVAVAKLRAPPRVLSTSLKDTPTRFPALFNKSGVDSKAGPAGARVTVALEVTTERTFEKHSQVLPPSSFSFHKNHTATRIFRISISIADRQNLDRDTPAQKFSLSSRVRKSVTDRFVGLSCDKLNLLRGSRETNCSGGARQAQGPLCLNLDLISAFACQLHEDAAQAAAVAEKEASRRARGAAPVLLDGSLADGSKPDRLPRRRRPKTPPKPPPRDSTYYDRFLHGHQVCYL